MARRVLYGSLLSPRPELLVRSELDRKLAAIDARRNEGHRKAKAIAIVATIPVLLLLMTAADRVGFRIWLRYWGFLALIVGGLIYALVSYFLVPEGED